MLLDEVLRFSKAVCGSVMLLERGQASFALRCVREDTSNLTWTLYLESARCRKRICWYSHCLC